MNERLVFHRRSMIRRNWVALLFIVVTVLLSMSPTAFTAGARGGSGFRNLGGHFQWQ